MILKGRYVVPATGEVIENGGLRFRDGRIEEFLRGSGDATGRALDYGDAVILPGLANAHTHLELSHLRGVVSPTSDFSEWLLRLVRATSEPSPSQKEVTESTRRGVAESLAAGTTAVGDITRHPAWTRPVIADSPLRGVSFGEIIAIGTRRDLLAARLAAAEAQTASSRVRAGLSPHAPYTVEPDALRTCARRAASKDAPLCIHLAETRDEERFTRSATGPLAELLRTLGVWDQRIAPTDLSPIELADAVGLLTPRTVIAHANYVSDPDLDLLARRSVSVAYCPRTHAAFGHAPHRFADMLARGINVCLGTDSLASNPSLSILEEMRFLRRQHPHVPPAQWLTMATRNGAHALGLSDTVGSLEPGKVADCVVVPLDVSTPRQWHCFLDSSAPPLAVYIDGRLVAPSP